MGNQDTPQLKILEAPLEGMVLVEASAGTGKTYTIAGLFIRLITEGRATIDQILVVTYTKAATAELRDRIRKGLTDAVEAFQMGGSDDVMLNDLVACCEDREQALLHLANALLANYAEYETVFLLIVTVLSVAAELWFTVRLLMRGGADQEVLR